MSAAYSALDMTTPVGAMGSASMPDTIAAPRAAGDEAATASCRFLRSMPIDRRMGSWRAANGLRTRWAGPGAGGTLGLSHRRRESRVAPQAHGVESQRRRCFAY